MAAGQLEVVQCRCVDAGHAPPLSDDQESRTIHLVKSASYAHARRSGCSNYHTAYARDCAPTSYPAPLGPKRLCKCIHPSCSRYLFGGVPPSIVVRYLIRPPFFASPVL